MMRFILVGIVVIMSAVTGYLFLQNYKAFHSEEPFGGPFTLVDQKGAEISEAAFRGHPTALFFGFTHCPEVCPTTLVELDTWLKTLGDDGKDIRAYFISIDPERDTPDIMDRYVSNVSSRITGITGDPTRVAEMAKAFKIYAKKVPSDDGDYTMDHTASILLLDSNGSFAGTIAYGENPDAAIEKLKRLAKS